MLDTKVAPNAPPRSASALPAPFACSLTNDGVAAWIRPVGELDIATSPQLERKLSDGQRQARLVVADLRSVAFADSSAMHALADASVRAQREGSRLVILRGPPAVDRIFALSRVCDVVEVVDLDGDEPLVMALLRLAAEERDMGLVMSHEVAASVRIPGKTAQSD